ncbi:Lrp/AsnC family transcriptional regulator [Candidatus Bathyarchaeota archaeon]|nr:MAG: Lrp/AsnC family transcriptional regulator [Candidatus Bathyarchaeota archaeon]
MAIQPIEERCAMTINVYVLIQVEEGEPWFIADRISNIEGVKTTHIVTGQYDIIAFAELNDLHELKDLIKKIHQVEGVRHTQTAVCIP